MQDRTASSYPLGAVALSLRSTLLVGGGGSVRETMPARENKTMRAVSEQAQTCTLLQVPMLGDGILSPCWIPIQI